MFRPLMIVVMGTVFLASCGDGGEDPTPTPGAVPSDFTYVRDTVLVPSCGFSSCHGSGEGSGGLKLTEADSYDELLNEASSQIPSMARVAPGDPDNSYLMWKLEGAAGIVEDPMPPPSGGFDEAKIASVRAWIAAGAPDN